MEDRRPSEKDLDMSVSVLITTFNRPLHLKVSLESLCRQPLENLDYEIVVINDAIEDDTEEIVSGYVNAGINIKYLFTGQRNKDGLIWRVPGFALNIAIQQSTSDIIVISNCDVYHLGNTLQSVVEATEKFPYTLGTLGKIYKDNGSLINYLTQETLPTSEEINRVLASSNNDHLLPPEIPYFLAVQRQHLISIGAYDEDFLGFACEDTDLVDRLCAYGCQYIYSDLAAVHLFHDPGKSRVITGYPAYAYNLHLYNKRKGKCIRNQGQSWGVPEAEHPILTESEFIVRSPVLASICIASYDRPEMLDNTLESIYRQSPPFHFETIVVDDGSPSSKTRKVCDRYPVRYYRIERPPEFRNPCIARNMAYQMAKGLIIIPQSDEVLHVNPDTIERLVSDLSSGCMLFANVFEIKQNGQVGGEYTGPRRRPLPFFFLGSLYREDLFAVGGNDLEFEIGPAGDDRWFADCLLHGRHVIPKFSTDIVGHHQYHESRSNPKIEASSLALYAKKYGAAVREEIPWCSSNGPWIFNGVSTPHPVKKGINSIVVCVEYDDFLAITLKKNKIHFDRTVVVTTWDDKKTQEVTYENGCECFNCAAFGDHQKVGQFNKGAALEAAFDEVLGRAGMICIWDADIVMPENMYSCLGSIQRDCLYTPIRRILDDPTQYEQYQNESSWSTLPSPTQPHEFSGYFQLFKASTILPPWYSTTSNHAGGCDSDFAAKFSPENRRRPLFEVLHLGSEGSQVKGTRIGPNWAGRVTPRIDTGEVSKKATQRERRVIQLKKEAGKL